MNDGTDILTSQDSAALPADLSEWVAKPQLWAWIRAEVESLDWAHADLGAYLRQRPGERPEIWLSLLTYAYACNIFDAEEIGQLCYRDPVLRGDCASCAPTGRQVSRFRRENRALLKWCLVQVFRRVLMDRWQWGEANLPAGVRRHLVRNAILRLELARTMIRGSEAA